MAEQCEPTRVLCYPDVKYQEGKGQYGSISYWTEALTECQLHSTATGSHIFTISGNELCPISVGSDPSA